MDWLNLPPLAALRAFSAYAETGSVQAAARALNVSHPAISQQIRNLEDHTGLALLDRSGRAAELTDAGLQLADALTEGFAQIERTLDALTGRDATRPLQVTVTPSFAANWLMPRLARFRAGHPDIGLMIDPSTAVQPLRPGGIDVALRYGTGNWPGLEARMLLPSDIVVVAAPSLIEGRGYETPSDLADLPWLQEIGTNEATRWLEVHGVTPSGGFGMTSLPGDLMVEAARRGDGVAITAEVAVAADIAAGRLVELFRDKGQAGYHVVTRPGPLRPALASFTRWLRSEARRS